MRRLHIWPFVVVLAALGAPLPMGPTKKEIGDSTIAGIAGGAAIGAIWGLPGAIIGGIIGGVISAMSEGK